MSVTVLQVSAGVGPDEAGAFVARLAVRMEALCEARGLVVIAVETRGTSTEPRSVRVVMAGDVRAVMMDQAGTHACVARSERRGRRGRKRWFAGVAVFVMDEIGEADRTPIDARDLDVTAMRAGGPGGQHVNKVATAVRVVHRPSGITVRASSERSQRANVHAAIARIAEALARESRGARVEAGARARMEHYRFVRGAPVATYTVDAHGVLCSAIGVEECNAK